jgi:hypothetical protein
MITAQVELLKRAPMKMIPIHADAGLNQFRALLKRMVEAEAQERPVTAANATAPLPGVAPDAAPDAESRAVRA